MYRELAVFIDSVKPTLRTFAFKQGERMRPPPPPGQTVAPLPPQFLLHVPGQIPSLELTRPMDRLFWDLLYPTLVRGHWRYLKTMCIGGVYPEWADGSLPVKVLHEGDFLVTSRPVLAKMDHVGLGDPLAGTR